MHAYTDKTVAEGVYKILDYYLKTNSSKKGLYLLLDVIDFFLPKPHNLPKTKYFLMKFIDSLFPNSKDILQKHRMCENCDEYLGVWDTKPSVTMCASCGSSKVNGLFVQYNLKMELKNSFEFRNIKILIDRFEQDNFVNKDFVCDITSSVKYQDLKEEVIRNKYDLCLLWNTDGVPVSNSSNGQLWLVQSSKYTTAKSKKFPICVWYLLQYY